MSIQTLSELLLKISGHHKPDCIQKNVDRVTEKLARFVPIRLWQLIPQGFAIVTGESTPTQKIMRR